MITRAEWEGWADDYRPDWRETYGAVTGSHVMRALYARMLDRAAYQFPLTEAQRDRVLFAVTADGPLSFRDVVRATGLDRRTARRALSSLVGRGEVHSFRVPGRPRRPDRPPRREVRVYAPGISRHGCKGCGAVVGRPHKPECEYAPWYSVERGYAPRIVSEMQTRIAPIRTRS